MPMRMPKFRFTRRVGKILLSIVAVALLLCGVAAWQVPKVLRSVLTEDVSRCWAATFPSARSASIPLP